MKVRFLKSGKVEEFHDEYCARLIEQGQAVVIKEEPIMPDPVPAALEDIAKEPESDPEPEKTEKPSRGRRQKG